MEPDGAAADDPIERLATRYVERRLAGAPDDLGAILTQLDAQARSRFLALVDGAAEAERLLPPLVREGSLLAGRYRLGERLGSGGTGNVFAAHDEQTGGDVAVKVLGAVELAGVDGERLLLRESGHLAALDHPGIVAIRDAGREGEVRFLVMDQVAGTSLARVLERLREAHPTGPPRTGRALADAIGRAAPPGGVDLVEDGWCRTAARVVAELARTVESAHRARVVHRDLKPGNIVLRGGGVPVVLDFGLAGSLDRASGELTRRLFGSAAYVAPEQVRRGQVGTDVRTDVYQLGLVLYELLTLARAFPGREVRQVLRGVRRGVIRPPRRLNREIPRVLEDICLAAVEPDPRQRLQSAADLAGALEAWLAGRRPAAARTPAGRLARGLCRLLRRIRPERRGTTDASRDR